MKKQIAALLCASALLLPVFAQANRQTGTGNLNSWSRIGKASAAPAGEVKITLTRDRKDFMDGGIARKIVKPKSGSYTMSVEFKGEGVNLLSFWNQIRRNGKYVYRVKTFPVKNSVKNYTRMEFSFDIPANSDWTYFQITARSAHNKKDAVVYFRNPVLKYVKEAAPAKAKSPLENEVNVDKYLPGVIKAIPQGHPRLFYNPAMFAMMKKKAATAELAPMMKKMEEKVREKYKDHLYRYEKDDGLGPNEPLSRRYHPLENWGRTAAEAAMLYRLTGDKKWADISIDLMKKLTPWYNKRFAVNRAVSWYGFSRVLALMAWDWVYDVMDKETRDSIAREMIAHARKLADRRLIARLCPLGEGLNGPGSGFYSGQCMVPWYLGIVFHGEGYDEKFVADRLKTGLGGHLQMLANRNGMAGDDGGSVNSSPAYCYGTYNNVEFYFFISYMALTGKNIAADFPGMGLFPFWLTYTIFRGIDGHTRDFGTGGEWHTHNVFSAPSAYHSMYRNFYSGPLCDVSDEIHKGRPWTSWTPIHHLYNASPFMMFFKNCDLKNVKDNTAFYNNLPKAYFFENLGQTYMHSGRKPDSTHVMFTCGAKSPSHKECDENHFVIYKGGYLALDAGTRTFDFSKKGRDLYYAHDNHYKSQSIAHNVVLIRMEGEKFRTWRFDPKKLRNHEGMNRTTGGVVRAYETNKDFTYIAGDSTACYNALKAKQVVRQFVMIYPDVFVIYDTVKSVKADQKKTWILHTQEEPKIVKNTFDVVQNKGRLICRTLLPENASLTKVGGPGKEFFVDGKNFHPGPYLKKTVAAAKKRGFDAPLWGHWRMEIRNPKAMTDNRFLNVIQVGLKDSFKKMIDTKLVKTGNSDGVSFRYNGVDYTITFDRTKVPSGHIKAVKNGKVLYNRPFTDKVQTQKAADYLK